MGDWRAGEAALGGSGADGCGDTPPAEGAAPPAPAAAALGGTLATGDDSVGGAVGRPCHQPVDGGSAAGGEATLGGEAALGGAALGLSGSASAGAPGTLEEPTHATVYARAKMRQSAVG